MPEPQATALHMRQHAASDAVAVWVTGLPGTRPLRPDELRAYSELSVLAGWRLEVGFRDRTRKIDLLLVEGFPRRPPRVALVDRPPFLTWPHVEEDGTLCLLGGSAEVNYCRPVEVAQKPR